MSERSESDCSINPSSVEDDSIQLLWDSGSTAGSAVVGPALATFHGWVYKHYFKVASKDSKNLRVHCKLCGSSKTLSSVRNSTSNFKKHLNAVHKSVKLVAREVEKPENKQKRSVDTYDSEPKRQCTLTRNFIPAQKMQSLLSEYVIEDMQPLSTVESPAFQKFINSICTTRIPVRKSFTKHLDKVYDSMIGKIKEVLEVVDVVCNTVDAWTAYHRSYLGMTAHWIDPKTLRRQKAAIACMRIMGRHTYDVLASKIEQVHASYSFVGKVCATITDNGSNFVKAFTVFSDSANNSAEDLEPEGEDVVFEDIDELLTLDPEKTNIDDDLTQVQYDLPLHYRCTAHTLNLVASKDADKFLSTSCASKAVYRNSFSKSSALWNKANRSTVASDAVQEVTQSRLIVPNATRGNSFYDAVVRITENPLAELNELCTKLELRCFTEREFKFLKEYCAVLRPVSRGLDILQGEDNCFLEAFCQP